MQQLPEFFILQTNYNHKYLSYEKDLNDLRLISKDGYSDRNLIFETEVSSVDGSFVSIKSSFNNKYLVVSKFENDEYLVSPTADITNEDESSESCTLFKPCFVADHNEVRFYHAHHKKYVCFSVTNSGLFLPLSDDEGQLIFDRFTFSDIEPEPPSGGDNEVYAFQGDNGKYLSIYVHENVGKPNIAYLKFFCEDTTNPNVWCHLHRKNTEDGKKGFEIKSVSENSVWTCGNSKWVVAIHDVINPHNTLFQFDGEKSALKVNGNYCQRYEGNSGSEKSDCLIANASTFTEQAKLKLVPRKPNKDDDSDTKMDPASGI